MGPRGTEGVVTGRSAVLPTAVLLELAQIASQQPEDACEVILSGAAGPADLLTVMSVNPRRTVALFARRDAADGSRWEREQ